MNCNTPLSEAAGPHAQRSANLSGSGWICHESGTSCRIICPVIRLDRVPLSQPVLSGHPEMRPLDGSCSFRHPAHAFQHVRVPVFMHLLCHLDLCRDAELVSGEKKQSFPAPWHTVFSAAAVRCLSVFHRFCFLSERTAPALSVALSGKCILLPASDDPSAPQRQDFRPDSSRIRWRKMCIRDSFGCLSGHTVSPGSERN